MQTARSLWAELRWSVCGAELCGSVPHDRSNWWNTTRQLEHISIQTLSLIMLHLIVCRMGLFSQIKSMRINIPPLSMEVGQEWLQTVARAFCVPPNSSQMKHLCQLTPPLQLHPSFLQNNRNARAALKKIWQLPLHTLSQKANIFLYKLGSPYEERRVCYLISFLRGITQILMTLSQSQRRLLLWQRSCSCSLREAALCGEESDAISGCLSDTRVSRV